MVLGRPVQQLIDAVGHDGSAIAFHSKPEPACRLGHHPQEVFLAYRSQSAFTQYDLLPTIDGAPVHQWSNHMEAVLSLAKHRRGVMVGYPVGSNYQHAVAFDRGVIFDPDGRMGELDTFLIAFKAMTLWEHRFV